MIAGSPGSRAYFVAFGRGAPFLFIFVIWSRSTGGSLFVTDKPNRFLIVCFSFRRYRTSNSRKKTYPNYRYVTHLLFCPIFIFSYSLVCVYLPSVSLRLLHDESMRMTSSNASPITEKEESRTQGLLLRRYALCAQQKKRKKCYVLESQDVVRTRIGHTRGGPGWNSTQFQKGWFWLQLKVFLNNTSFFRFNVRAHLPYLLPTHTETIHI